MSHYDFPTWKIEEALPHEHWLDSGERYGQ